MADLKKPSLMYLKAVLFCTIALCAAIILVLRDPSWTTVLLVLLVAWASARAYYFVFYVIEKYIDDDYKFSGITSFVRYLIAKRKQKD